MTTTPAMPEPTQKQLDAFIKRAGFSYGWLNLESSARRMAERAVWEIEAAKLATLQAQPAAEASDAELLDAYNSIDPCNESPQDRLIRRLRAILALRPHVIATAAEQVEPRAYLICGGRLYKDQAVMGLPQAEDRVATRGDGSRIEPLYTRALRQQAVPMTEDAQRQWRFIRDRLNTISMYQDSVGKFVEWFEAHHGITAQGGEGK